MATLTQLTDTNVSPVRNVPATDLQLVWINNWDAARTLLFSSGLEPQVVAAHNHARLRGKTLRRHLLSLSFGPQKPEGAATSGGDVGVPLWRQDANTTFSSSPKLIASCGLLLPGGVKDLRVHVAVKFGGILQSNTLEVEIRPFRNAGLPESKSVNLLNLTALPVGSPSVKVSANLSSVTAGYVQSELDFTDLSALPGSDAQDRFFELAVWLKATQPNANNSRLVALITLPGTQAATLTPLSFGVAPGAVTGAEIHAGNVLSAGSSDRGHRRALQAVYELLGNMPGYQENLPSPVPDTARAYRYRINEPHNHRGKKYTDEDGTVRSDGAVPRYVIWAQHYGVAYGDNNGTTLMDGTPYKGIKFQASGGGISILRFNGRGSIPAGLGAIEVRFAVLPEGVTDELARIRVICAVYPIGGSPAGNGIAVSASSPGHVQEQDPTSRFPGYVICQADPEDGELWQSNAERLHYGKGLWTYAAERYEYSVLDTSDNAYRISKPLRVGLSSSGRITGPHNVTIGLELETGASGSGTFPTTPRLQWVLITSAEGY